MNKTKITFLNTFKSLIIPRRNYEGKPPPKSWTNGVKYHGFTYYPRYPDEKDPPVDPPKLFMVQRIKPFHGNWFKLKRILTNIGLGEDEKMSKVVVVKNIPEMNRELWKIKHLVKITPVKFMNGEPTNDDINYCHLNEWGELTITKKISDLETKKLELTDEFLNDPLHLDADTKKKDSRLKWLNPYK
ncbi:mitochondrial ribosomal protein L30 [Lycorma delicatula]|uniref:mitochondrial ribosomal protein L30 n=1 Tax=Lycorma delicatula TaxID=130591 RepID=UPI003F51067B